jgi:hypothetical protein
MYKIPQKKCRLRDDTPVRFNKQEYQRRQEIIYSKGLCQVCEESTELDAPHHAVGGIGTKDDRTLICICLDCHRHIHAQGGYSVLKKTKAEIIAIGWANNEEIENDNR